MNLLIVEANDFIDENAVRISGRRAEHIIKVLKKTIGDSLRAGELNGNIGTACITSIDKNMVYATLCLDSQPPLSSGISLLLGLPRPKMLKRMLRTCAELAVDNIILLNSYRVEKSYWQSPMLNADNLREYCLLGLEQSGHTQLPDIQLEKRFKPFVEDRLPSLLNKQMGLVAHPHCQPLDKVALQTSSSLLLALGPEGGFIDYEVNKFLEAGCITASMGPLIMRCDTALPYAIASLNAARSQ